MIPLMSEVPLNSQYYITTSMAMTGCLSCVMHEDKNYISGGEYYIEIEYSMQGDFNRNIYVGTVIFAKNPSFEENQMFVVTNITKGFDTISIRADHISILLAKRACLWLRSGTLANFFNYANEEFSGYQMAVTPFVFSIEGTAPSGNFVQKTPVSFQQMLGGTEGSALDVFGGDFVFDNLNVKWMRKRGSDNFYHINYGLNMLDFTQELSYGDMTYGLVGYVKKSNDSIVKSTFIDDDESFNPYGLRPFRSQKIIDVTNEFENADTVTATDIYAWLSSYHSKHLSDLRNFDMSVEISMVDVFNNSKYRDFKFASSLNIGDTVHVYMPKFNIAQTSVFENENVSTVDLTVRSITYDVLTERVTDVELGNPKLKMIDAIVDVNNRQKKSVK